MCSAHEHLSVWARSAAETRECCEEKRALIWEGVSSTGTLGFTHFCASAHTHPPWSTHPQQSLYSAPCVFLSLVHLRRDARGPEVTDRLFLLLLLLPVFQNFYPIHYEPLVEVALAVTCSIVGAVYLFRQQTRPLFQCALWSCALHFDLPFFPCDYSRRLFADFIQIIRSR